MGSTTPVLKFRYPVSTDKIAKGAVNIEELSEDVEANTVLANDANSATAPYTSYPDGATIMFTGSGGGPWPYTSGVAYTVRRSSFAMQMFWSRSTVARVQQTWARYGYNTSSGAVWSPWSTTTVAPLSPQVTATGVAQVPGSTDGFARLTVTLPGGSGGLFSHSPAVVLTLQTGSPNIGYSVANVSKTSFEIIVDRPSGAVTTVHWFAASNYTTFDTA